MSDAQKRADVLARLRKAAGGMAQLVATEPVAVVGMACRFPGDSNDPDAFWRFLEQGGDGVVEAPPSRWDLDAFYDPDPAAPGKINTKWGAFLSNVTGFDAGFFGISPREALAMDPQQRLVLTTAWEALDAAGIDAEGLAGSATGVFLGVSHTEYALFHSMQPHLITAYSVTGNALSIVSNRVNYTFDFQGPSVSVDTACSSALVAIHFACQSLRLEECRVALAGGANTLLFPETSIPFSKYGMLAPDGRCKTFDAAANGYVRGEGVGVVVLKRLADAEADGDRILAVVRGSAINQDGNSNGLTAPNGVAQRRCLRNALAAARVRPSEVTLIEAHGTGTSLGDPIEVEALADVYGQSGDDPCYLGSAKANVGHMEAAAGVGGFIKMVLSLQHGTVPPLAHFKRLNPGITLPERFRIPTEPTPWATKERRRGAVSSFGFGGTNVHVILEEAPERAAAGAGDPACNASQLLTVSARSEAALRAMAGRYRDHLDAAVLGGTTSLRDVCFSAGVRRTHHDHRLAVAGDAATMRATLDAVARGETPAGAALGVRKDGPRRKILFVFPGQGSHWAGMGAGLMRVEPVFREAIQACAAAFAGHVEWKLGDVLDGTAGELLERVDVLQAVTFAMEIALARLWRSWGVEPDAVVGHSMGEVAAACVAGALSLPDATRIMCERGALLRGVAGRGGMASVELSVADAQEAIAGYPELVVAISNGPSTSVLAGDAGALTAVLADLAARGVVTRRVNVDVAYHSPHVAPLAAPLRQKLAGLSPESGDVRIYTALSGEAIDGARLDAAFWADNLAKPVRFWEAFERALGDGHDVVVEVSPHPILLAAVEQGMRERELTAVTLPSLRRERDERGSMLESYGRLYASGIPLAHRALYPAGAELVPLPAYAWQLEDYWYDIETLRQGTRGASDTSKLLGKKLELSGEIGADYWELDLDLSAVPWLQDHVIRGTTVFPGSGYVEMVHAAALERFGAGAVVEDLELEQMLMLAEGATQRVQLTIRHDEGGGPAELRVFGRPAASRGPWSEHARATVRPAGRAPAPPPVSLDAVRARCTERVDRGAYYQRMYASGLEYGTAFQTLHQVWRRDGEALAELHLADGVTDGAALQLHPTLLDASFQMLGAAAPADKDADGTYVPVGIERLDVYGRPQAVSFAHATLRLDERGDAQVADIVLVDRDGSVQVAIHGFRAQRIASDDDPLADTFYEIQWHTVPPAPPARPPEAPGTWLVLSDAGGVGAELVDQLEALGERCVVVEPEAVAQPGALAVAPQDPEAWLTLLGDELGAGENAPCRGVVHLWSLDPADDPMAAQENGSIAALHLVQALTRVGWRDLPRLSVVTRGAQRLPDDQGDVEVGAAPLWGLAATIRHEHGELPSRCIDLDPSYPQGEIDALLRELLHASDPEDRIAHRAGTRHAARLCRWRPDATTRSVPLGDERPFALDGTQARPLAVPLPGAGEVQVAVRAVALDDGGAPRTFAGTVLITSHGGPAVGTTVVGRCHTVGSHLTLPAAEVAAPPAGLDPVHAAALPEAYLTAARALGVLGIDRGWLAEAAKSHAGNGGPKFGTPRVSTVAEALDRASAAGTVVDLTARQGVMVRTTAGEGIELHGTTLVTGGLGGLGLTVARWLVEHGARSLLLMSRSEPGDDARPVIEALRAAGAQVTVVAADVADRDQLAAAIARCGSELPPLRAVFHLAGVVEDGLVRRQTRDSFRKVMASKVAGTWNLHELTAELPLDAFVLFSSAASILGSPGQANYTAANAFEDAVAHLRRARGLPGLAINWGPWAEVGMAAAAENREARLVLGGFTSLTPGTGTAALGRLLGSGAAQVGVFPINLRQWRETNVSASEAPLLAELLAQIDAAPGAAGHGQVREQLTGAEIGERRAMLEAHLQLVIAGVLRLPPEAVEMDVPFNELGLDSLMGLEIRNKLEASLGVRLAATLVWSYPNIAALAPQLAKTMAIDLGDDGAATPDDGAAERARAAAAETARTEVSAMSSDEVSARLVDELADVAEFLE